MSNDSHAIGNNDGRKTCTPIESTVSNCGHTTRNFNGGKASATTESNAAYTGHVVRNNCFLAAYNKSVAIGFDDGIAIVARVIDGIPCRYLNGFKTTAAVEIITSDTGHAVGNNNRSKATTFIEILIIYALQPCEIL